MHGGISNLDELENKSIYTIREARAQFKNPAVLWSTGKDSTTLLWLIKKALFGEVPFPLIHIDTTYKFQEIYRFRDEIAKKWNLNLMVIRNNDALKEGVSPKTVSRFKCCTKLKTEALKQTAEKYGFDAIYVSIRRDEHGIRGKERYFSPRDQNFTWPYLNQPTELSGWGLLESDFGEDASHVRIHPILHWTELDVWRYIKKEKLPVNPLYFTNNGKRYRSLGCRPCTTPVRSNASTIDEIISELMRTKKGERAGRAQDKEDAFTMQRLRALGYL